MYLSVGLNGCVSVCRESVYLFMNHCESVCLSVSEM